MDDKMGQRIKQRRLELHMTQTELAEKIGVKHPAIHKYETGMIADLKRSTISNLAKALDCSPLWLMGTDNEGPENSIDFIADVMLDPPTVKMLKNYMILSEKNKECISNLIEVFVDIESKNGGL